MPAAPVAIEAAGPATVLRPDQANVVVLTTDSVLFEEVRAAIEGRHRIWRAESPTHAAELILAASHGVLLLDAAVTLAGTADVVRLLRQQLPELAIVVAGRRDDEAALSPLISVGDVFRFLHKPLSAERTRTFIDGAVRRQATGSETTVHRDRRVDDGPSSTRPAIPPPVLPVPGTRRRGAVRMRRGGMVVVLCAAAIGTWLAAQRTSSIRADQRQAVAPATSTWEVDRNRLLAAAAAALDAGRLAEPRDDNAIELYRRVLRHDAGDATARQGLQQAGAALLLRAEHALQTGDLLTAAAMLDAARFAEPPTDHLHALQHALQTARARISAGPPAGTIRTLDPDTVTQIGQQEARALLGRATASIAAGNLTGGPQSAAALLEAARASNPSDPAVTAALDRLSELLVLRAREALTTGRYADAARWNHEVEMLQRDPAAAMALARDIDAARRLAAQQENQRLLDLARQRIAEGRLVTPEADSAWHYIDLLRAADAGFAGLDEAVRMLSEGMLEQIREHVRQHQWGDAERGLRAVATLDIDAAALRHATDVLERVRSAEREPPLMAESELHRTRHVAATYPPRAASAGLQGSVELEFTIGTDGATRDLTVLGSSPPGTFDQAAIDAVTQWRYQPVQVDGIAVPARARVRLRFLSDG